jgi:hypothetical protein
MPAAVPAAMGPLRMQRLLNRLLQVLVLSVHQGLQLWFHTVVEPVEVAL